MNIWRVNLQPSGENDAKVKQYCFDNRIAAMGWRPDANTIFKNREDYRLKCATIKDPKWPTGERQACSCASRDYFRIENGDFVIARSGGDYYVGKVIQQAFYVSGNDYPQGPNYNMSWAVGVDWKLLGKQNKTPSIIIGVLSERQQATIQRRNNDELTKMCQVAYSGQALLQRERLTINNFAS